VLAAGCVPATLLLFGLGASGTPPLAAIESTEQGPQQEERPLTRSYHGAAVVNGKIYDPASGRWTRGADLATARGWFSTSVVNGKVYLAGGRSFAPGRGMLEVKFPEIEVYTPTPAAP
jgi:hypothetical protein